MANKIDIYQLMIRSIELIMAVLPNAYEIDDWEYSEDREVFQFGIFDSKKHSDEPVDRFRFYRHNDETDGDMVARWDTEVNEYCERWNKK